MFDFEEVEDLDMHLEDVPHEHCGACMTLIDRAVVFTYFFHGPQRLVWCHDCAKLCRDVFEIDMLEDLDTAIIEHEELRENDALLAFAHRRIASLRAHAYSLHGRARDRVECEIGTIQSKIEEDDEEEA
jgi:hypothetical protein